MKRKILLLGTLVISSFYTQAQGTLSGDLMMNANFFQRDSSINAANNPLYDKYLSGGEGWLSLRYNYKGFTANLRADAFHNSNLYNPTQALNGFGLGAWTLSKEINKLTITGGTIYDQIGSGILFRAYEDRGLLIDNALVGLHLKYKLTDNIQVKAFTGQSKFLFDRYKPIIKGINFFGDFSLSDNVQVSPGLAALNRTLDQTSMDGIVSSINNQEISKRFVPRYNTYAFTAYNNLIAGDFSWYVEGAYKTHEAILVDDALLDRSGTVLYSTLSYARKGLAVNLSGKRTDNFVMRTSPNEILLRGILNWQPIVARLRPQRLMARYSPASQDVSEMALGGDVLISPNDNLNFTLNYTHINTLDDVKLFREAYAEVEYRGWEKALLHGGVQYMEYNQERYQIKPGVPMIKATTVFAELTYRINKKNALRIECEYQDMKQDYGSWLFALLEYTIAPKWAFAVSDMYNIVPNKAVVSEAKHYYNIFAAYTDGPHRFTIAYVKQVEGINCTGGVCRYEPAFSGVRIGVTSSF